MHLLLPILFFLKTKSKIIQAVWLLLSGHGDAAHEVLLGVNETNLELAEYAATHPGQTTWQRDHPLDDVNDLLHSLIHRCEGLSIGEGGHSGIGNAKYWAAGGPKEYFSADDTEETIAPAAKLIHRALLEWSTRHTPKIAALLVSTTATRTHSIIASGGKRRRVKVRPGCWDPFTFIDLSCSSKQLIMNSFEKEQLNRLQEFELRLLLRYLV